MKKIEWISLIILFCFAIFGMIVCVSVGFTTIRAFFDNSKCIQIEKRDIYNKYPIISEDEKEYKIEVPYDRTMYLPKNGGWVEHPDLKNMKCGWRFYRYINNKRGEL